MFGFYQAQKFNLLGLAHTSYRCGLLLVTCTFRCLLVCVLGMREDPAERMNRVFFSLLGAVIVSAGPCCKLHLYTLHLYFELLGK